VLTPAVNASLFLEHSGLRRKEEKGKQKEKQSTKDKRGTHPARPTKIIMTNGSKCLYSRF
jgi:hypothetical protein